MVVRSKASGVTLTLARQQQRQHRQQCFHHHDGDFGQTGPNARAHAAVVYAIGNENVKRKTTMVPATVATDKRTSLKLATGQFVSVQPNHQQLPHNQTHRSGHRGQSGVLAHGPVDTVVKIDPENAKLITTMTIVQETLGSRPNVTMFQFVQQQAQQLRQRRYNRHNGANGQIGHSVAKLAMVGDKPANENVILLSMVNIVVANGTSIALVIRSFVQQPR